MDFGWLRSSGKNLVSGLKNGGLAPKMSEGRNGSLTMAGIAEQCGFWPRSTNEGLTVVGTTMFKAFA
jgi:hypothetical protein